MFFRWVLLFLIAYFAYRYFKSLFAKESPRNEVKGDSKSKPIDLRNEDVQDADYEDIK